MAKGRNLGKLEHDPTAHGEMVASAAARSDLDQTLEQRAPDLELAHERVLDQCGSGRKAQGDDLVAESEVGPIGDRGAVARAG